MCNFEVLNYKMYSSIFSIENDAQFLQKALQTFIFQYENCNPYYRFCNYLNINPEKVKALEDIPFLPISFFKDFKIIAQNKKEDLQFSSSGTTGNIPSKHFVANAALYQQSFTKAFKLFYGPVENYTILALLPNYLERGDSSLVYMVQHFIAQSNSPYSGFYLYDLDQLIEKINFLEKNNYKTLLIGVSYALLNLIDKQQFSLKNTIVMETGGMKGKRKELIKEALHLKLKEGFGLTTIHSEYGMTELLSQAYSKERGIYKCPPWMKVLIRDTENPKSYLKNKTGGINIIDLANKYSCSFIATQDLGVLYPDGSFSIKGRFDYSDVRGCNLMVL